MCKCPSYTSACGAGGGELEGKNGSNSRSEDINSVALTGEYSSVESYDEQAAD